MPLSVLKLTDFKNSPIYKDDRLTQYNRKFKCYKFRTMKAEYSGMTAEKAFIKMGKLDFRRIALIRFYSSSSIYKSFTDC